MLDFNIASHNKGAAPYFREYLREELKKWCTNPTKPDGTNYNVYTDGLKVHTTINSRLQNFAEKSMRSHISSLQKDFDHHWSGYTNAPYPEEFTDSMINAILDQAMRRSERYRKLKKAGKYKWRLRFASSCKTRNMNKDSQGYYLLGVEGNILKKIKHKNIKYYVIEGKNPQKIYSIIDNNIPGDIMGERVKLESGKYNRIVRKSKK